MRIVLRSSGAASGARRRLTRRHTNTGIKMLPFAVPVANQGPRAGSRDSSAILKVVVSGVVRAFGLIAKAEKTATTTNNGVTTFGKARSSELFGRRTARCADSIA
jgi:hypothetical protein